MLRDTAKLIYKKELQLDTGEDQAVNVIGVVSTHDEYRLDKRYVADECLGFDPR